MLCHWPNIRAVITGHPPLVAGELGIAAIMVSVLIQILATLRLIITQAGQHFTTISNIWVLRWIASHLMH